MNTDFKPVPRKNDVVVQELNGEVLIYDLGENKAFCLNETSALVWQACNGEKNISEISRELGAKLNAPADEDLVWLALDQLKKENLIENKEDVKIDFNGMSRRDVIKKVGLGTMIALPIVTGLIAPTVASAASTGLAAGQPSGTVTTNGDDCGGTAANQTTRANRCNNQTGSRCASGTATFVPGTCTFSAATNQSTFDCQCT